MTQSRPIISASRSVLKQSFRATIVSLLVIVVAACGKTQSLSNGMAEGALKEWGTSTNIFTVKGVQLIPENNTALVDFDVQNMEYSYQVWGFPKKRKYSGSGQATFVRYTDDSWVLKGIQVPNGEQLERHDRWEANIKVK